MRIEKTFCDRCGEECESSRSNHSFSIYKVKYVLAKIDYYDLDNMDLCQKCYDSLAEWMKAGKADREVGEEEYKRGWRDAIQAALSETHNVHTEEGTFRVVQEETLVGVGMSIERER